MFLNKLIFSFLSEEMDIQKHSESYKVRVHLREILQETFKAKKYKNLFSQLTYELLLKRHIHSVIPCVRLIIPL